MKKKKNIHLMYAIRHKNFEIYTQQYEKITLTNNDDKKITLPDGRTIPYVN